MEICKKRRKRKSVRRGNKFKGKISMEIDEKGKKTKAREIVKKEWKALKNRRRQTGKKPYINTLKEWEFQRKGGKRRKTNIREEEKALMRTRRE